MDSHDLQHPLRDIDTNQVSFLYQGNGAAFCCLRGYMPDSRSLGSAGETAVCNQSDGLSQLRIRGNRLRSIEHLRHTRSLRSLIADEYGISRLDPVGENRRNGIFLTVKGPCL